MRRLSRALAALLAALPAGAAGGSECGNITMRVRIRSVLSVRHKEDTLNSAAGTDAIADVLESYFEYDRANVSYLGRGDPGDADYQVAFVVGFTALGDASAFDATPSEAFLSAEATSGLAVEVKSGLPLVGDMVFSDNEASRFTSLGGFAGVASLSEGALGGFTGVTGNDVFYVQPPRSDSATPDSEVMWRLWARVPVTIYLDFWGGEAHAVLPSWLRDVDVDGAQGGWLLRTDIEGIRFADETEVTGAGVVYSRDFPAGAIDINGGNEPNGQGSFVAFVAGRPDVRVAAHLQTGEAFRAWRDEGLMDDLSRQLSMNVQGAEIFLVACPGDEATPLQLPGTTSVAPLALNNSGGGLSRDDDGDVGDDGGSAVLVIVAAGVGIVLGTTAAAAWICRKRGAGLVNNAAPAPTSFGVPVPTG